jgi:predicted nucleic acid-binding protein
MKIFLDANILISVVNNEYPLFTYTSRILSLADHSGFEVYTSAMSLGITWYFSEKKSGSSLARKKMNLLCDKLRISNIGQQEVGNAIGNPKLSDFEDALQYYSALNSGCQIIITEDRAGFPLRNIPAMGAKEFLTNHYF